jgi:hypothetical protein
VGLEEIGDRRCQIHFPEGYRGGDDQLAGRCRLAVVDGRLQFVDFVDQLPAALDIDPADLGQGQGASGAVEQAGAEALLELADVFGHQRRRHAEALAGGGEGAGSDDRGKGAHADERIH